MDEQERELREITDDFETRCEMAHRQFCDVAGKSFRFWDKSGQWVFRTWNAEKQIFEDIDYRDVMLKQAKNPIIYNGIFAQVQVVVGVEAQNRVMASVVPRSSEDGDRAAATNDVLKFLWDKCDVDTRRADAFLSALICGRGWLGIEEVESDGGFSSTKTEVRVIPYNEIAVDPFSRDFDLSDAEFLRRQKRLPKRKAKLLWADKETEIENYGAQNSSLFTDSTRQSGDTEQSGVLLTEYWYYDYQRVDVPIIEMGEEPAATGQTRSIIRRQMKYSRWLGEKLDVLLESGDSPYIDNLFPYVPIFAYRGVDFDFGVVEQLKEPQQEANLALSAMSDMIRQQAGGGKMASDDADFLARYNDPLQKSLLHGPNTKWKHIPPPDFPQAYSAMHGIFMDGLKQISGISDDLRGIRGAGDSGVVVDIRRQQSLANVAPLFDGMARGTKQIAILLLSRMRQYMEEHEILQIIGDSYNKIKADDLMAAGMSPEEAEAAAQEQNRAYTQALAHVILADETAAYDIAVDQAQSSPTSKAEQIQKLQTLAQSGVLIPPEVTVEIVNPPKKEQIIAANKALMGGNQAEQAIGVSANQPANAGGNRTALEASPQKAPQSRL